MLLEQIKSKGLSHFSYILGDEYTGECVVIDPRRDVDVFLKIARQNNLRITNIIETHIHADFVSGSLELSDQTGAPISISASAEVEFDHRPLLEGSSLSVGRLILDVIHTPGHTPEHICLRVSGGVGAEKPWGLFSGDTLFAGEVGRPDLLGEGTEEQLARKLYHSLKNQVIPLGSEIIVYPAHGEGSPCGASIGDRSVTTIGYEQNNNPVLKIEKEDKFVRTIMDALSPAPAYYGRMKRVNSKGPKVFGTLPHLQPIDVDELYQYTRNPDHVILDTRSIEAFGGAHLLGAINIGLREPFPIWAGEILDEAFPIWTGRMIDPGKNICLILSDVDKLEEVQRHLFRIGYENISGYLPSGMRKWLEAGYAFASIPQMSVHELHQRILDGDELQILDVRTKSEWRQGHIPTARNIYVPDLLEQTDQLSQDIPVVTYCGSGYRASIAASILEKDGFTVINIPGSMTAWQEAGYDQKFPNE